MRFKEINNSKKSMEKIEPSFNKCQRENNIKFLKGVPDEFRCIAKGAEELKKSYKKVEKLTRIRNMDTKTYFKAVKKDRKAN